MLSMTVDIPSKPMKNAWTKKNPLMSMWLSSANAIIGPARSRASAEGKRQAGAALTQATRQLMGFWTGASTAPAAPRKRKKRR